MGASGRPHFPRQVDVDEVVCRVDPEPRPGDAAVPECPVRRGSADAGPAPADRVVRGLLRIRRDAQASPGDAARRGHLAGHQLHERRATGSGRRPARRRRSIARPNRSRSAAVLHSPPPMRWSCVNAATSPASSVDVWPSQSPTTIGAARSARRGSEPRVERRVDHAQRREEPVADHVLERSPELVAEGLGKDVERERGVVERRPGRRELAHLRDVAEHVRAARAVAEDAPRDRCRRCRSCGSARATRSPASSAR